MADCGQQGGNGIHADSLPGESSATSWHSLIAISVLARSFGSWVRGHHRTLHASGSRRQCESPHLWSVKASFGCPWLRPTTARPDARPQDACEKLLRTRPTTVHQGAWPRRQSPVDRTGLWDGRFSSASTTLGHYSTAMSKWEAEAAGTSGASDLCPTFAFLSPLLFIPFGVRSLCPSFFLHSQLFLTLHAPLFLFFLCPSLTRTGTISFAFVGIVTQLDATQAG